MFLRSSAGKQQINNPLSPAPNSSPWHQFRSVSAVSDFFLMGIIKKNQHLENATPKRERDGLSAWSPIFHSWFLLPKTPNERCVLTQRREAEISPSRSSSGNAFVKVHPSRFSEVTQKTSLEHLYLAPAGIWNPATPAARKTHLERQDHPEPISHISSCPARTGAAEMSKKIRRVPLREGIAGASNELEIISMEPGWICWDRKTCPETEHPGRETHIWRAIFKPAVCEQLEHWPHRDCGTSLKASLSKITFVCVRQ